MQLNTMYLSNRMKHLSIDLERSRTVGKKRHKPCGLKQWKCIVSQFWMLLSPKSRCWQGPAPSETQKMVSCLILASGDYLQRSSGMPKLAAASLHCLPLMSVITSQCHHACVSFYKDNSHIGLRANLLHYDLVLTLFTSTKTLLPNKVTF